MTRPGLSVSSADTALTGFFFIKNAITMLAFICRQFKNRLIFTYNMLYYR